MLDVDPAIDRADTANASIGHAHREMLRAILEIDERGLWREDGARDTEHWLSMRYGVSTWKAQRWVGAAHALERLPVIATALASGDLGMDKVCELARFATSEREVRLLAWAQRVSCYAVRQRGDVEARADREAVVRADRDRRLEWWYLDDGRRFGMEAEMPAAEGAVIAKALERLARRVPVLPGEEDEALFATARRADALVALASTRVTSDPDPDRATVIVHATVGHANGELEDGRRSTRRRCSASSARRGSRPSFRTRRARSERSRRPRGSRRRGCSGRCGTATAVAGSPAAAPGGSPRLTTSGTGATAGGRPSRTWR
jgi:hypothetical protein